MTMTSGCATASSIECPAAAKTGFLGTGVAIQFTGQMFNQKDTKDSRGSVYLSIMCDFAVSTLIICVHQHPIGLQSVVPADEHEGYVQSFFLQSNNLRVWWENVGYRLQVGTK